MQALYPNDKLPFHEHNTQQFKHTDYSFVSRDAFGVRPLYILGNTDEITKGYNTGWLNAHIIGFSSELKQLSDIYHYINNVTEILFC